TEASRTGNSGTVSGTVAFPEVTGPQNVGGTRTNYANAAVEAAGEAAGITLTGAEIAPLPNNAGLRFTWKVNSMPDQVPPEGVRYTWGLSIDGRQYQLQAKRTNMASVTTYEDPQGHIKHLQSQQNFFQLRGACVDNYFGAPVAVSGCYHLAFLNGSFNPASKTVTMDWPYETKDSIGRIVAADFKPGAALVPLNTAGMSIGGSFQAFITNATLSNFINNWQTYFVGGQVHLGVGTATASAEGVDYTTRATVDGGSFTGTVTGMSNMLNTVFVRACNGTTCAYASIRP
ncbi:MAG: hypothetical protein M3245_06550, partial [Actinomycetota bacterium]|nr:hypothetical protein [Actinomycetota bacterium]